MPGRGEELAGRRELDDAPQVHDADAVRDMVDHREIVRDEEVSEPHPPLQIAHQVQNLRLHRNVERRGRLVADEKARLRRQRTGNRNPLALTAGELVRIADAVGGGEPDLGQQRRDPGVDCRFRRARFLRDDGLGDDVGNSPPRIEACVRVLKDHLHAAARAALPPRSRRPPHRRRRERCRRTRSSRASARAIRRLAGPPSTSRIPIRRRGPASRPRRSRSSRRRRPSGARAARRSRTRFSHGGETSNVRATSVNVRSASAIALTAATCPGRASMRRASNRPARAGAARASNGRRRRDSAGGTDSPREWRRAAASCRRSAQAASVRR